MLMKWFVHFAVAVFTGLIAQETRLGILVALAQLLPIADIGLKYLFGYKPLHTIWGFVVMVLLYEANLPFVYIYLSISHALHLVLDVNDGIELFAPWSKKQIKYPVRNGERIVLAVSAVGIVILAFLLAFFQ